jgi:hypothetical protein
VTAYSAGGDPQRLAPGWLAERAISPCARSPTRTWPLTLYTRTAARQRPMLWLPDAPPRPLGTSAQQRPTGRLQSGRSRLQERRRHPLFLYAAAPDGQATVGLLDGAGNLWAETTVALPTDDMTRQQIDLLVPPEAPTGRYCARATPPAN